MSMFLFQIRLYIYTRPILNRKLQHLNRKPNKNEPFADRPRLILGKCWTKYGMISFERSICYGNVGYTCCNLRTIRYKTETYNWYNYIHSTSCTWEVGFCSEFLSVSNGELAEIPYKSFAAAQVSFAIPYHFVESSEINDVETCQSWMVSSHISLNYMELQQVSNEFVGVSIQNDWVGLILIL